MPLQVLAISVGNTTTRFGRFEGSELARSLRAPNASFAPLVEQVVALASELPQEGEAEPSAIVLATTNGPIADRLVAELEAQTGRDVFRIGADLPIPVETALDPGATPGQDRLLNAIAAFDHLKQACVVVDCGTAVTVDFIDGEGVFQGGAIAPGANMQLHALHHGTAALPHVHLAIPSTASPFGKDTVQAMLNGVYYGIRGTVRLLVERYAEAYEAYPPIIVTGGDAPLIFDGDELIDRIIPDLTLWGIEAACRKGLLSDSMDLEVE
ncbi:MAG: type III pantothenate kinase [Phycisphaerae bacterium]|nr:type III pantothenate kinase [Phycisphaerae bacterium]